MRIYTRSGDHGTTGIHGGERVEKDDVRIEANGALDELNAVVGLLRVKLGEGHEWQGMLKRVQEVLMVVMSHVATPSAWREKNPNTLPEDLDRWCEGEIDRLNGGMRHPSTYFVLPGGTEVAALCHLARTVARRAERRLWTLNREDEVPGVILRFVNRLRRSGGRSFYIKSESNGKVETNDVCGYGFGRGEECAVYGVVPDIPAGWLLPGTLQVAEYGT